mgnify:CR=1 FL=1|jgi:hypothetical protein
MADSKMLTLADELKELRDKKADLDYQTREVNGQIEGIEQELIQEMTNEECESFKRNGITFSLVVKEYPAAVPEMKGELYEKMKAMGFEHLFTINTQTLQATLKELKSNNDDVMPDWLDGLVKVAEKASIRVAKK